MLALLAMVPDAQAQYRSSSIIVRLRPGITEKPAREAIASVSAGLGMHSTSRWMFDGSGGRRAQLAARGLDRYVVVELDGGRQADLLRALNLNPMVEAAFENHRYHLDAAPQDSLYKEQWAQQRIEAEGAWDVTLGDSTVLVGIIDTGIELDHPDLAGAFAVNRAEDLNGNGRFDPWPAEERRGDVRGDLDGIDQDGNGFADDVIGYDFIDQTVRHVGDWSVRDPIPVDEQGHGTNVAGVIGARHNSIGVAGMAPGARLVILRAFDASGNGEDDDVAAAVVYAADRGVKVLNLSFGDYYNSPLLRDAIAYAYGRGVMIVASSGNEGGSDPHYPSSFPEVMAVGATTSDDFLSLFSTHGSQLSMTAPGVDIYTTDVNGRYKQVGGTSFSAPYVAATAALILSVHPDWTPDEVRTVMELAADDRGRKGWDVNYGAGRLNARRAMQAPGPASATIRMPYGDTGFGSGSSLEVIGSAIAPLLESWQLLVGQGDDPDDWTALTEPSPTGRLLNTLGTLDGGRLDLDKGVVTLRLLLRETTGRETERRVRLYHDIGKPAVLQLDTGAIWRFQDRAYAIMARTNQATLLTAWLRPAGDPSAPFRAVSLEPERTGYAHRHYLFLTGFEMQRDLPYEAYLELRNFAGDTALIGSPAAPFTIVRSGDAFSTATLAPKPYVLPYGYLLDEPMFIDADNTPSLALNRFTDGTYDKLMVYSFTGGAFVPRDSIDHEWIPRGFGDTDGDGLQELLCQSRGTGVIFEQGSPDGNILASVAYADTTSEDFWGSRLYDLDGDGRDEVIARTDNNKAGLPIYFVARRQDGTLERIAELPNTTAPAQGDSRNKFGPPFSAVADFNGDGRPGILFGDDDADFMIYEREPDGTYRQFWTDENNGEGGSEYIAAGDIDGDGRAEAIVAYHSSTLEDINHEYAPPTWTVKIFTFDAQGNARLMWQDRFAYIRPTLPFLLFSGISAGNLDRRPGDEVAISFFPSLYVLTWDADAGSLKPFWYAEGSIANKPVIADFDKDGVAEIGFGDGEQISFHQIHPTYPGPPAPSGFKGWTLNDSSAWLQWNPVPGADYYTLYRGLSNPGDPTIRFDSVAITTSTSIIDTGFRTPNGRLLRDRLYYYVITTRDLSLAPDDLLLSNAVIVFTHPPTRIIEALPVDERSFRVIMDFRGREALYEPGAFDVVAEEDGRHLAVSTVIPGDRFSFLVTLAEDAPAMALTVRPGWMYRDFFDSPADTSHSVRLVMKDSEPLGERFIATRAAFAQPDRIIIEFNVPVDPVTAANVANYVLSPGGAIGSAQVDPADPRRVILTLSGSYPVGPLGRVYTVTITNVQATDGRLINDGAGSVVGFTISAGDLAGVFVYPHPFSISRDVMATFAGLTRAARVTIFTQSGTPIRTLEAREGNGGAQWNGADDNGRPVPSGVYLYSVTGSTPDGTIFESELRKIAVVP